MDIITQITREIKRLNSDKIGNSLAIRTLKSAKADLLNIEAQNRPLGPESNYTSDGSFKTSSPMVGWAFLSLDEKQDAIDAHRRRLGHTD